MKIYSFSIELEAAAAEVLGDTRILLSEVWNYCGPVYVKALRYLKAKRPSVFQICCTGAQVDHPGDRAMWDLLSASEKQSLLIRTVTGSRSWLMSGGLGIRFDSSACMFSPARETSNETGD
jgi:hypothetical protein